MRLTNNLSTNFKYYEMIKSEQAIRHGIDNTPPDKYIPKLKRLCEKILQPIRNFYQIPFTPNSAYRSLELNAIIGGASTSQHCKAEAVDIEVPGVNNYDLAIWVKNNLEFDQLILEYYIPGVINSGWVHISLKEKNNRYQELTYTGKEYLNGLVG
jgi:hypothetical protein